MLRGNGCWGRKIVARQAGERELGPVRSDGARAPPAIPSVSHAPYRAHAMPDLSHPARSASLLAGIILLFTAASTAPRRADVPLSSLDLTRMKVQPGGGRGAAQTVAQANKSIDGNPIHIGGKEFTAGVGTRANSVLFVQLNGGAEHFSALVGADDNPIQAPPGATAQPSAPASPPTPIVFRAVGDGRVL